MPIHRALYRFQILTNLEYKEKYSRSSLEDSYLHMTNNIERRLWSSGLSVNGERAIKFLTSEELFATLSKYASQALVSQDLLPVRPYELQQFFATKLLRSRFNMSFEKSWEECMKTLSTKHGFTLMDNERFDNILTSIRGYNVTSRTGDSGDNSWKQRKKLLHNLNDLEKTIFKNSSSFTFNTKNGTLVMDDELVSFRAGDVEAKSFTNRKAGKDGPISDAMADSMICLLLGMRLRVTG